MLLKHHLNAVKTVFKRYFNRVSHLSYPFDLLVFYFL